MATMTAEIIPARFPELKKLVWNRNPDQPIRAEEVFALYERNWRFVDRDRLTPAEVRLLRELEKQYGHDFPLL